MLCPSIGLPLQVDENGTDAALLKFVVSIPGNQRNPSSLLKLLAGKGAGTKCWVISENSELDGQEIDLQTALEKTIGYQMGTFISCIPGKLAYFEDEDGRYILER
jgi:hypothetical protein